MGFDTCLTSNNKEPRVAAFAKAVNSKYIYKANKPSRSGYLKAMEMMGTNKDTTLFVGDQLFTDILLANKIKAKSVLVEPLSPNEWWATKVFNRTRERLVWKFLFK